MQGEKKNYYLGVLLRSILSDIVTRISSAKMPAAAGALQGFAPSETACFSFVIPTPVPHKRLSRCLSRRCGLLPAMHEGVPPPSFTCLQLCTRNEQAPVKAAVQTQSRRTWDKPSRLKHPLKESAQASLSEGMWPSFIERRRLSCNTDFIQQLPRWLGMTPG